MPHRPTLLLALILVTPLVLAQTPASRVQREASNPLRMIIEASKFRPKAKPAEPARSVERTVPAAASEPLAAASAAAEPPRIAAPAGAVESTVTTVEVATEALPAPAPPPAVPDPAAAPAAASAALPAPLQLANMVEPVTPRALLGRLRGEVQVVVGFTVNADGRVADPAVRSSSHPQMDEAVLEAVRQWRYQPIVAPRGHEVQLVLRPAD
jgi:protein TonB